MYIPSEANNRTYCHDCILPKQKIKNVSWRKPSVMKSLLNKNLKPAQHRLQKILSEGKKNRQKSNVTTNYSLRKKQIKQIKPKTNLKHSRQIVKK